MYIIDNIHRHVDIHVLSPPPAMFGGPNVQGWLTKQLQRVPLGARRLGHLGDWDDKKTEDFPAASENHYITGWWFNEHVLFSPTRLGMIIQSDDTFIFFKGVETTN